VTGCQGFGFCDQFVHHGGGTCVILSFVIQFEIIEQGPITCLLETAFGTYRQGGSFGQIDVGQRGDIVGAVGVVEHDFSTGHGIDIVVYLTGTCETMLINGWESDVAFRETAALGVEPGVDGFRAGTVGGSAIIAFWTFEAPDLQGVFAGWHRSDGLIHVECFLVEFNGMVARGATSCPSGDGVFIKSRVGQAGCEVNRVAAGRVEQFVVGDGLAQGCLGKDNVGR